MKSVLIVNSDRSFLDSLRACLSGEGFLCLEAEDAAGALAALAENAVDLLLLDVPLPDTSGFELLRALRAAPATAGLPIIMLSARGDEVDRVVGLEMGADDYVTTPCSSRELVARIRALLRRACFRADADAERSVLVLGDMALHRRGHFVVVNGKNVRLTHQEMTLLLLLAGNAGRVTARETLYRELFGRVVGGDRNLDMTISRLRKKLGPRANGESRIRSARGEGYALVVDEESVSGPV